MSARGVSNKVSRNTAAAQAPCLQRDLSECGRQTGKRGGQQTRLRTQARQRRPATRRDTATHRDASPEVLHRASGAGGALLSCELQEQACKEQHRERDELLTRLALPQQHE